VLIFDITKLLHHFFTTVSLACVIRGWSTIAIAFLGLSMLATYFAIFTCELKSPTSFFMPPFLNLIFELLPPPQVVVAASKRSVVGLHGRSPLLTH
jgi:hypothetical protein